MYHSSIFFNRERLYIEAPLFRSKGDMGSGDSLVGDIFGFRCLLGNEGSKIPFGL